MQVNELNLSKSFKRATQGETSHLCYWQSYVEASAQLSTPIPAVTPSLSHSTIHLGTHLFKHEQRALQFYTKWQNYFSNFCVQF